MNSFDELKEYNEHLESEMLSKEKTIKELEGSLSYMDLLGVADNVLELFDAEKRSFTDETEMFLCFVG